MVPYFRLSVKSKIKPVPRQDAKSYVNCASLLSYIIR
jgi:hypothetical protein